MKHKAKEEDKILYTDPLGIECHALVLKTYDDHTIVNLMSWRGGGEEHVGFAPKVPYSETPQPHTWRFRVKE